MEKKNPKQQLIFQTFFPDYDNQDTLDFVNAQPGLGFTLSLLHFKCLCALFFVKNGA